MMQSTDTLRGSTAGQRLYRLMLAALLCAIGIVIPMFMPRIPVGPMTFTLASHVAIFIGMFISPAVSVAVCVGTTVGFFITTPFIVALRAASHLIFATVGACVLKSRPQLIDRPLSSALFNFGLAVIHGAAEAVIVAPLFFSGGMSADLTGLGFFVSIVLLVGVGTMVHSMVDYSIAIVVWKPLRRILRPGTAVAQ